MVFMWRLELRLGVVGVLLEGWGGEEHVSPFYTNNVIALGYASFFELLCAFLYIG